MFQHHDISRDACMLRGPLSHHGYDCHLWEGAGKIAFGLYACSPEDSSFTAVFTDYHVGECMWKAHDGQKPDEE